MAFQKLSVSKDNRRLINADGSPFFYLADTAWELFHRLTKEEACMYLKLRAETGYTAIQAVALAEFDGIATANAYGRMPIHKNEEGEWDIDSPDVDGDYSYWDHVDFIINEAASLGLYIALLPCWGDKFNRAWGKGPELLNGDNAYRYGKWLAGRYGKCPNIIWVLGGDRKLENRRHFEVICHMAEGIRTVDVEHLMTFHPQGGEHSSTPLHDESWLDFNMIQSGHSRKSFNYKMIIADYNRIPVKPILDAEPGYEDHPDEFNPTNGYLDAADVRFYAYMSLLSGACGHTYGNHSVWGMIKTLPVTGFQDAHFCLTWDKALYRPGAAQMQYAKDLMLSRDFLSGKPCPDLIAKQLEGLLYIPVLKGKDYLFAYTSQGLPINLKANFMDGRLIKAGWHDPRNGSFLPTHQAVSDREESSFTPPSSGRGNDWVLVIDCID